MSQLKFFHCDDIICLEALLKTGEVDINWVEPHGEYTKLYKATSENNIK